MRRLLLIIAWLSAALTAAAQVDTIPPQQLPDDSLYYEYAAEETYQAPNINPIYYFGSPFCEHFAEIRFQATPNDFAIGADYAYLPEVWGFHASAMVGKEFNWLLAGADYRLSKPWNNVDWHLYGSVGISECDNWHSVHPALEVGVRVGSPEQMGRFCLTSATLGLLTTGDNLYVTIGFGLTISVLASSALMLTL